MKNIAVLVSGGGTNLQAYACLLALRNSFPKDDVENLWKCASFVINRIYENAESIFKEYTLDEIDNQFLMQPYCGFRFTGEIEIEEECES